MANRQMKLGVIVLSCLFILAVASFFTYTRRQAVARRDALSEGRASFVFKSIQPVRGKVLLDPAPPNKKLTIPIRLYNLSKQETNLWTKPRIVAPGFEFCYFDGARDNCYRIIEVQADGVILYEFTMRPPTSQPEPDELFKMRWK